MSQRPNRRIDKATRLWQGRRASIALIAALYCLASVATAVAQDEGARFLDDVEVIDVPPLAEDDESPFINDVEVVDFPHEEPPLRWKLLEAMPRVLSWPDEPLGNFFGHILHMEHDHVESELDEYAIGLQQIPERPPLLVEWNELFLGPGWLEQGIETPTGAIWRPAFWMFGEFRTALQHFDLIGMRPLDEERGGARNFSGYELHDGDWIDGWNSHFQTLFFEGDFGEIFPRLDPYDSRMLDYGFSVGRMPLLAQQGLLINEDMIDAVTMTRNTLNGHGNLNLRTTGVYSWRGVNRNSPVGRPNDFDPGSKMVAILTESDFAVRTVNLDATYVYGDPAFGNLFAVGASSIRRHHGYHNTYNTSLHLLASIPEDGRTDFADQGELLFAQTSWTPHHTEDLIYLNSFWAIDQFTSPARGPAMGNALGQTGLLFGGVALGQYNAPIAVRTDNVAGASLGYQMFFDHTRQQVIWEVGGYKETKGASRGAIGSALRYQKAIGQHSILVMDGFVSKHETRRASQGARIEWRIKF
jgi:hypothetical protein